MPRAGRVCYQSVITTYQNEFDLIAARPYSVITGQHGPADKKDKMETIGITLWLLAAALVYVAWQAGR